MNAISPEQAVELKLLVKNYVNNPPAPSRLVALLGFIDSLTVETPAGQVGGITPSGPGQFSAGSSSPVNDPYRPVESPTPAETDWQALYVRDVACFEDLWQDLRARCQAFIDRPETHGLVKLAMTDALLGNDGLAPAPREREEPVTPDGGQQP